MRTYLILAIFAATLCANGAGFWRNYWTTNQTANAYPGTLGASSGVFTNSLTVGDGGVKIGSESTGTEWLDAVFYETSAPPGNKYGIRSQYRLAFGTNSSVTTDHGALLGQIEIQGTNDFLSLARGVYGYFKHDGSGRVTDGIAAYYIAQNLNTGYVENLVGTHSIVQNIGGTVKNAMCLYVPTIVDTPGNMTNIYGLKIDNQPEGRTATYSMWIGTNLSYFSGPIGINSTLSDYLLSVRSKAVNTTPVSFWRSDNGGALFNVREDASKNAFTQMRSASAIALTLHTAGTTFFNGGDVAIGKTTAGAKLDVEGSVAISTNLTVGGSIIIRSNSWTTIPTLAEGDNVYASSNGIPHVIWKVGGVQATNRLVP